MFNVWFLSRWKPFDGTKGHKHPEYKRIKNLNKSFENQKELENHLKTYRTLKNQKNLEKTNKTKKNLEKTKKNNKTQKTKKKQLSGGLGEAPQLPEESRIYVFFVFFGFIVFFGFLDVFLFFLVFSRFFVLRLQVDFRGPPPFSLSKELFSRPRSL